MGRGYSEFLEGEMGDAVEDGAVSAERRELFVSLSDEEREEDTDRPFCEARERIWRNNSPSSGVVSSVI